MHWPLPSEHLDAEACSIVRRLASHGFEAYLVGGCVRDLMFGLRPKDFDVVTSATPRDVKRVFRNCRIIGRRFRLAHVFYRDKIIEVATFRSNAPAPGEATAIADETELPAGLTENAVGLLDTIDENGNVESAAPEASEAAEGLIIRDDNVFGTAEQDAVRRDFTINALFYDVERETIIDYVGGVQDVERKLLRTIGDPAIRMREDPIRMLRAIRLASRLGCTIDHASWDAIERFHPEIMHAAAPRILEDILRMFRGGAIAPAFDMMLATGVIETIMPELFAHLRRETTQESSEEVEALRRALLVADAWTQSGRTLSDPVQLALLLTPTVLTRVYDAHGRHTSAPAVALTGEIVRPIAQRLAISKRDSERIRRILLNLPASSVQGRRRRRGTGATQLLRRHARVVRAVLARHRRGRRRHPLAASHGRGATSRSHKRRAAHAGVAAAVGGDKKGATASVTPLDPLVRRWRNTVNTTAPTPPAC
ncbi:MAG: polynucleotide adenylyltransferase PcnB [Acidobacteriota bacterium]